MADDALTPERLAELRALPGLPDNDNVSLVTFEVPPGTRVQVVAALVVAGEPESTPAAEPETPAVVPPKEPTAADLGVAIDRLTPKRVQALADIAADRYTYRWSGRGWSYRLWASSRPTERRRVTNTPIAAWIVDHHLARREPGNHYSDTGELVLTRAGRELLGQVVVAALCAACAPATPQPGEKITDLMAALAESVEEAKEARARHPRAADTQEAHDA